MTCFVAHMKKKGYFDEIGIEVTKRNAKDIEREIARVVGLRDAHCPEIWKETKVWLADPKKKSRLYSELKQMFGTSRRK